MYKILSLDGGGSWALIQLLTLKEKYGSGDKEGHEILREFDLIIANSGGSIVLAALAENWTIDHAISLFDQKTEREKIFKKNNFKNRFFPVDYIRLFANFGPKYSSVAKGNAFKNLFPELDKRLMSELPLFIGKTSLKIVVCTYDAINNRAKFFKSYGDDSDFDAIRLTQAINGSTNAPVQYFDFPARFQAKNNGVFYELWDGALGGFNNPVAAGVIEAYKAGVDIKDIKIVSIGTSNKLMSPSEKADFYNVKQKTIEQRRKKFNFLSWKHQVKYFTNTVLNQAKTIIYEPPDWANYVAYMFISKTISENVEARFIRLSPLLHIDDLTDENSKTIINQLYNLDMDLTTDEDISLVKECFRLWVDSKILNHPINFTVNRQNQLTYIKGDRYFKDAIAKW